MNETTPTSPEAVAAGLPARTEAALATADLELWAIVPTYNEADGIVEMVSALLEALPVGSRVLIVDDNSPDGTGRIADRLAEQHPSVSILHRPEKVGLGPAYIAGFQYALARDAGLILQMDADLSHDPGEVPNLLKRIESADVVLGSRYVRGGQIEQWGNRRKQISRWGSRYARAILGIDISDLTGGFKLFRAEVLRSIDLETIRSRGYAFQVEITYRASKRGYEIAEVPITFYDRRVGKSKMTIAIVLEAAWRVPAIRLRGSAVG